jgi:hypothetical protein
MWKLLLVILAISIAFFYVKRNQQKKPRDRTGELIEQEHVSDIYGKDILDAECSRILKNVPRTI